MKSIIITGASSGIGQQTALLFASKGWRVAATMRKPERLSMFDDQPNIKTYLLDVRDTPAIAPCFEKIVHDFGRVDVLVNNAGVYDTEPLEVTPDKTIDMIIDTNISALIYATRAIIPHFRKNKAGTIINISSVAGRITTPFQSIYHCSKWAVEGFSEALRYELTPLGIHVKLVEPGIVSTPLWNAVGDDELTEGYPEEYHGAFRKWWKFITKGYEHGYAPAVEAMTIYKAATGHPSKLRYTTDATTKQVFRMRRMMGINTFQKMIQGRIG